MVQAPRHLRSFASSGVLLALIGVWLGHGVEYLRVWGLQGLDRALIGGAHAYMIPLGVVLAGIASLLAVRAWSSWQRLALRLDRSAAALRLALRGTRPAPPEGPVASWPARVFTLALSLALLQVCLYLVQENIEAVAAGLPAPGLGAITGVHWAAALIQLDVAFLVLAAVVAVMRRFSARVSVVRRIESLLRVLASRLRPRSDASRASVRCGAAQRHGRSVRPRAPPLPA